ncbi:uncharacterized protein MYCGRDRAFT_88732 [Zymoseptoria tritici IPO323]|uniref:Uncharacterized protein n=1 Tax=Zymoseptoria tritici (strain CBS 115943 / IPO323) TaxID=336722 RepID=F9WYN8_ZYMTI|nr:uncharacterized protein MYCGRDRAFT_88732 [Zymoseptoria tritici IPO323]EGP90880.1 hypothetical protein MYCGRDRAFT_88732 [Zymoseptoria tritici IPO323]
MDRNPGQAVFEQLIFEPSFLTLAAAFHKTQSLCVSLPVARTGHLRPIDIIGPRDYDCVSICSHKKTRLANGRTHVHNTASFTSAALSSASALPRPYPTYSSAVPRCTIRWTSRIRHNNPNRFTTAIHSLRAYQSCARKTLRLPKYHFTIASFCSAVHPRFTISTGISVSFQHPKTLCNGHGFPIMKKSPSCPASTPIVSFISFGRESIISRIERPGPIPKGFRLLRWRRAKGTVGLENFGIKAFDAGQKGGRKWQFQCQSVIVANIRLEQLVDPQHNLTDNRRVAIWLGVGKGLVHVAVQWA